MSGLRANRITNAAVYLDGNSYFGRAEEVDLGSVNAVMSDYAGLGMVGATELPDGLDKLEGKIIWTSLYEDAASVTAAPFKTVSLQCRSSISVHNSQGLVEELPMVSLLTVRFKGHALGSFKARDPSKFETPFSATYIRQLINGREVLLLDYMANIYRVNGKDQLAQYRANLGQI